MDLGCRYRTLITSGIRTYHKSIDTADGRIFLRSVVFIYINIWILTKISLKNNNAKKNIYSLIRYKAYENNKFKIVGIH